MFKLKILLLVYILSINIKSYALQVENMKIFITENSPLDIEQVSKKEFATMFCDTNKCKLEATSLKNTYWIKFTIKSENIEPLILELSMFYYDIKTYFFTQDMVYIDSSTTGYQLNINKRKFETSANAIQVPLKTEVICFIKFKTYLPMGISILVLKNSQFINSKLKEHNYNGIINGIFLLAIIYSGFFALLLRNWIYLYYMCYVISFWMFIQPINHITPMYFSWLNLPFTLEFYIVPHFLMSIFLILYSNKLLHLKHRLPIIYKINSLIIFTLIAFLATLLTTGFSIDNNIINNVALLPSFIAAIILIIKRYTPAWFVFSGIALILIPFTLLQLHLDQYMPIFFVFSFYGILEVIIFGISITYWLKSLFIEKESAMKLALNSACELSIVKENQNLLLEKEVELKTLELKIANQELEKYVQKVENLNVNLEKDNSNLKVKVIDQITARSEDKSMNFNEFKISFPDEQSCYNRLEYLKWNSGYKCPRCGNLKYLEYKEANTNIRRRCSTCRFIETTTSSSLFHNIKFPIQKAFYLTYIICTNKNKTLEELSLELEMRTATIHAFSKKIKEAKLAIKPMKKHKDGWTHVMLYNTKKSKQ